jgi:hypothetical protein
MNERIDQLLVKAGAYFGGEGVVYDAFDPKKFAQLIVLKCAEIADTAEPFLSSDLIKQHFGVDK